MYHGEWVVGSLWRWRVTCLGYLPFAALAAEGQEVELVAEGHLAVGAYRFDVGGRHGAVAGFLLGRVGG